MLKGKLVQLDVPLTAEQRTEMDTFHLFHRLWTKAVGNPLYSKPEWNELESRILAHDPDPHVRAVNAKDKHA